MNAHIYLVTNNFSGKQYVGQTVVDRNKVGHGLALTDAYEKYGKESFSYDRIFTGIDNQSLLDWAERFWISVFGTIAPGGYNIASGGKGKGSMSESTKAKLRAANLGKVIPPEVRDKIRKSVSGEKGPFYGRTHTPEAIAKIKAANIGKVTVHSAETRAKISRSKIGAKNGMFGKKHTEETKAKFKGRPVTRYWLGKKFSDEVRAKISASHRARPQIQCPHCLKVGGSAGMLANHFDFCKQRPT